MLHLLRMSWMEQIITYDLSNVKELEDSIFTAILINLLSLSWDNCVTNGIIMKEKWEQDKLIGRMLSDF